MKLIKRTLAALLALIFVLSLTSCNEIDPDYGAVSEAEETVSEEETVTEIPKIKSIDQVMPLYFDISNFDEEDYADIYLGESFGINAVINGNAIPVPAKVKDLEKLGWEIDSSTEYKKNSLIRPGIIAEITFKDEAGNCLYAQMYNSENKSVKFNNCSISKFRIENKFYSNRKDYAVFNINGIVNEMAITDVIATLGTPSHFHAHSKDEYYLDYFISKQDRRNGITVCINTADDIITAVEFSYYE